MEWNDKIPVNDLKRWRDWLDSLYNLCGLRLARCTTPTDSIKAVLPESHNLSGVPETGCSFACYARRQLVTMSFLWSLVWYNLHVASPKTNFVPRLELTAAYLPSLQYRSKWFRGIRNFKPGDVVTIVSDVLSRAHWP